MLFNKKSTLLKCHCYQQQGHLVKHYTISQRKKEHQAILTKPLKPETSISLVLSLEAFTTTETEIWETQVEKIE